MWSEEKPPSWHFDMRDGSDSHRLAFSKSRFLLPACRAMASSGIYRNKSDGPQAIFTGEEKPRCEVWTGEYQIFTFDSEGKTHQISEAS